MLAPFRSGEVAVESFKVIPGAGFGRRDASWRPSDRTMVPEFSGALPFSRTLRTRAEYMVPACNGSHGPSPLLSRINSVPPLVRVDVPIAEV